MYGNGAEYSTMPLAAWVKRSLAAVLGGLPLALYAAPDDIREANRLYAQGQPAAAAEKVKAILAVNPRDSQARFLSGLILAGQNKTDDAITIFTDLIADFPELPEPYNNLAVLYASQGKYELARGALETAIQTHPSYATARENLGDIHVQLAIRAYERAAQLDKTNTSAARKLMLIRQFSGAAPGAAPSSSESSTAPVVAR